MKKSISLWLLLSIIFSVTLLITNTIFYGLILKANTERVQREEEKLLLSVGKQVALEASVTEALFNDEPTTEIETYTTEIADIYGFDFVVIMNMAGIRLTHPSTDKIGKPFEGGDETTALKGKEHISISKGTLGNSLRGFVPIYNQEKQIGVVALGIKLTSLESLVKTSRERYAFSLLISLGLGLVAAFVLAYYLKSQLLNLEPKEITQLLEERNAMLNETKDIVVVTNSEGRITLANIAATELYHQLKGPGEFLEGQPLTSLLRHHNKLDFNRNVEQLYRQNGQDYLFYVAPIVVRNQTVGSIIFLRNATESLFVMDQLANTTSYASALQSQSHEFMNKLHVIYGLVDLEAYIELKTYLNDMLAPDKAFTDSLSILVKNPLIAGFLVGEREKFIECKTTLNIEISSELAHNADQEKTIAIMNLYRYIHHVLLQQKLPDELAMSLETVDDLLISHYIIDSTDIDGEELTHFFQENYFKELLKDARGTFELKTIPNKISLILTTNYEGGTP